MLIIGHRGAKGLAPENTKNSLKSGIESGADCLEFDVRLSRDGIAVLAHDNFVLEGTKKLPIHLTPFSRLRLVKNDLLTLESALRFIDNRLPVIVEIKPGVNAEPIIDCITKRLHNGWDAKNIKIASFDIKILRQISEQLPQVGLIVNEKWSGIRASVRARQLNTRYLSMNQRWLWSGFIKSMSSKGYKLSAYTLNNPKKAKNWADSGLYGVITDYPDKF